MLPQTFLMEPHSLVDFYFVFNRTAFMDLQALSRKYNIKITS